MLKGFLPVCNGKQMQYMCHVYALESEIVRKCLT
jgi:hypothetical protein